MHSLCIQDVCFMAYTTTPIHVVASFQQTAIHTGQYEMKQDRLFQACFLFLRRGKKRKHDLWGDSRDDRSRVSKHNGPPLPTISSTPPHLLPVSEDIMWGSPMYDFVNITDVHPRPKATVSTVKPVYNDHLMGYFSAVWSSSRWPMAT